MMTKIKDLARQHRQFLLYALIGSSGVTLDLVLFIWFYNGLGWDKNLATTLSTGLAILNNFIWNAFFNFKTTDKLWRRLAQFYAVGIVGIILTIGLFKVGADWLGLSPNLVKVLSLPAVLVVQFWLNRRWTFQ